MLTKNH